jgi:hypothetical protein
MLHQLEQHSICRRRMNERYQRTTGAFPRCFVNQSRPALPQLRERLVNVRHLYSDMVNPRAALRQKPSHG